MKTLVNKTVLPVNISEAWQFFSSPKNLSKITPKHMNFKITTDVLDNDTYAGQIISYRVSPLPWLRTTWITEITQVAREQFFIDEQRVGPYKIWHHEHYFKALSPNKTEMVDRVFYELPFYAKPLSAFIDKKVADIFQYRETVLNTLFR